jgi:hypothetical protein
MVYWLIMHLKDYLKSKLHDSEDFCEIFWKLISILKFVFEYVEPIQLYNKSVAALFKIHGKTSGTT